MINYYVVTPSTPGQGLCIPALGDTLTVVNEGTEAMDVSIGMADPVFLASVPPASQYVRTSVEAVTPAQP